MSTTPKDQALAVAVAASLVVGVPTLIASTLEVKLPYAGIWGAAGLATAAASGAVYYREHKRIAAKSDRRPLPAPPNSVEEAALSLGADAINQIRDRLPRLLQDVEQHPIAPSVQMDELISSLPVVRVVHSHKMEAPETQHQNGSPANGAGTANAIPDSLVYPPLDSLELSLAEPEEAIEMDDAGDPWGVS